MKKKTSKKGIFLLTIGLIFIVVAFSWFAYNIIEDYNAGRQALDLLDKVNNQICSENKVDDNKEIIVDGENICGIITIDKLDVQLPVYEQWNYERLKVAPCRYTGSIYTDDIVIAAHNYKSHFGNLELLQRDDEIRFLDVYGTSHEYSVKEIIALDGTDVTDMKSGDWDFTLFTCTVNGRQRVTVRCNRVDKN